MRIHKLFWQLVWKLRENFIRDLRGCWKQKVLKKRQTFHWKNTLAYFFSYYRTWKKSRGILEGSTMYFDKNCAIVNIISSGPKRSIETNISTNSRFHNYKRFSPFLLVLPSVTKVTENFRRVHKLLWHLHWKIKQYFLAPEKLLKTQRFEKRANFPVMKRFWPNFSGYLQHEKCQGTTYNGPQGFFKFFVQKMRSFYWDLRVR